MPSPIRTALLQLNVGRHNRKDGRWLFWSQKVSWQPLPLLRCPFYGLATRPTFFTQENDWIVWSNSPAGYGLARNALPFGNESSEGLTWPVVMMI